MKELKKEAEKKELKRLKKVNRKVRPEDVTEGTYIGGKISKEKSDKVKALMNIHKGTKEEIDYKFYYLASLGMRIGDLTIRYNMDIEKYNNKKENWNNQRNIIKLDSADRKRRRFFEGKFKNTDTKVIELDGKENKKAVVHYILNTYPVPQILDIGHKGKNWTGAKMKEIFNSSENTSTPEVVIGNGKYEIKGLEYSEEDYERGIQSYIQKQKKKIPFGTDTWVYVIMSIRATSEKPELVEGVVFQKYEVKIMNIRYYMEIQEIKKECLSKCGREKCNYFSCNNDFCEYKWKRQQHEGKYEIKAPLNLIISRNISGNMVWETGRKKYMFSYFLSHRGNKKHEEAGKRARVSWNKFQKKVLKNTVESGVSSCSPEIRDILHKKYLYLDMGENLFLILRGKTVSKAKLVKDWRIAKKKGYIMEKEYI